MIIKAAGGKDSKERALASGVSWYRWGAFVLGALLVYVALYAWSEYLVYEHAERNRFFMISNTAPQRYDFVILGASHAMPLGYGDSEQQLELKTGVSIMNLSSEGAGILPNRLLLDLFLSRHKASHVIYVVDEFAFYSPRWNEDRLDASALNRAPLDAGIAAALWRYSWSRDLLPMYLSGFGKINNQDRFSADMSEGEIKFDRVYSPIAQLDRRRVEYLFPEPDMKRIFPRYLAEFDSLANLISSNGMELIVIRPPTPLRYRDYLPDVSQFTDAMARMSGEGLFDFYDFSEAVVADPYFYDTDHLNRDGVKKFVDEFLTDLLKEILGR